MKAKNVSSRRAVGTLLLIMYAWVFYITMMSLTAYQIQSRVQALGKDGISITIWSVARTAAEYFTLQRRIDEYLKKDSELEKDLFSVSKETSDANVNYWEQRDNLILELRSINPDIDIELVPINQTPSENASRELLEYQKILILAKDAEKSNPGAISQSLGEFRLANYRYTQKRLDQERLIGAISDTKRKTEELKGGLDKLATDNHYFNKIIELTDELRFFYNPHDFTNPSWLDKIHTEIFGDKQILDSNQLSYSYVTLPSEVLIILVVIAMGTMGSLINITQIYFTGENKPITFFMYRPLLGAVVAIGVYVITKAGVLVSSNIGGGEEATLNAFFVSFVSLISGLLSETAINSIKDTGVRFLRGDNVSEKARYANGVAKAMKDDSKCNADLYPYFQYAPQEIDKWLTENELVPGEAQRIIAAWLEKPVRDLFSDISQQGNQQSDSVVAVGGTASG